MSVSIVPTLDMERAIAASGYDVIVGFDEVGRGSLAGPVMVGAAAIRTCDLAGSSPLQVPDGVADSKMLTEHRREAIFEELKSWCASWAVGSASNTEIDDWGHLLCAWHRRIARTRPSGRETRHRRRWHA